VNRERLCQIRRSWLRRMRNSGRIPASGSSDIGHQAPTDQLWRELPQPGGWQAAAGLALYVGNEITLSFGAD
jgi:hypothetical protein